MGHDCGTICYVPHDNDRYNYFLEHFNNIMFLIDATTQRLRIQMILIFESIETYFLRPGQEKQRMSRAGAQRREEEGGRREEEGRKRVCGRCCD